MKPTFGVMAVLAICLLCITGAFAQRNLSIGSPVTEDFNTVFGTGTVSLTNNTSGLYAFRTVGNAAPNSLAANNGSTNTGALYNMGTTGSSDRAFGTVSTTASGTNYLGVRLVNNGATTIGSITVQFTGETWRHGNGAAETLTFDY